MDLKNLEKTDAKIAELIRNEMDRQENNIELIASENFTSQAVMGATGSLLTNKYAEGYPGDAITADANMLMMLRI